MCSLGLTYQDIVLGDVWMGVQRPIVINSKLGWLLSGPIESSSVTNLVFSLEVYQYVNFATPIMRRGGPDIPNYFTLSLEWLKLSQAHFQKGKNY